MMRAHLLSSDDPIKEGQTYWAVCGACVENATYKFFFDEDFRSLSEALSKTRVCEKCIAAKCFLDGLYVYGIVQAKKMPESESCEEMAVA